MPSNYQHQKISDQVSQIIKKYEASPQSHIRMATPAVALTAAVIAVAAKVLDDAMNGVSSSKLRREQALIHSARESNSIQEQDKTVMPSINDLLAQREKFLTQE